MSGICGLVDFENKIGLEKRRAIVQKMSRALANRGTAGESSFEAPNINCSLRRFYADAQTMNNRHFNSDQSQSVCTMDGGVYNTQDITTILSKKNNGVPTNFLISQLYDEHADEFINHLDGEFALAIWDKRKKELILAKDQLGSKPLFYHHANNVFIFASEIKSILASQLVPIEANLPAINDFMSFGYVPHPETMFKNILHVEPGTLLRVGRNNIQRKTYWQFEFKDGDEKTENYYTCQFMGLLQDAVKKRVNVNMPIGAYLSGGVDSSGICGILAKFTQKPFKAISIGFKEDKFNEIPYAEMAAKHLNLDWVCRIVNPKDIFPLFEKTVYLYDSPFEDNSTFPSYISAKTASEYVKIVLTGDGPDQLMAGSDHHIDMQNWISADNLFKKNLRSCGLKRIFQNLPFTVSGEKLSDKVQRRLYKESLSFAERIYFGKITPLLLKRYLYTRDFLKVNQKYPHTRNVLPKLNRVRDRHLLEQYLYFDIYFYMHDNLIPKVDRTCLANSIEPRSPYRDKELLKLMENLPLKYRLSGLERKYLLKKAFEGLIPKEVIYKKKQGFVIPRDEWFIRTFRNYIEEVLLDQRTLRRGYFNKVALEAILRNFFSGKVSYYTWSSGLIMCLLTLELWHRIYIDNKKEVGVTYED